MRVDGRYCDRINMTPQQFQDYKSSKVSRIFLYIIAMIFVTIFKDRLTAYIFLTLLLILSYYNDSKKEEQWLKDGDIRREDLE